MNRILNSNFHFIKMDEAGDGKGGGGGGSLLTNNNAGGGGGTSQGQQGTGSQAAAQAAATGTGDAGAGTGGDQNKDWRSALSVEFREDPALKVIHDVNSLAKSYIHAQKMVGADKVTIPGKQATDQDWQQTFEKLGLPKDLKDYALKVDETASVDKKFMDQFKENAHKAGILPQQAQKLADWFTQVNKTSEEEAGKQLKQLQDSKIAALKQEWGAAYDVKLKNASRVLTEVKDPELNKYLDESGFGSDPRVIKLFDQIATKYMKEDTAVGGQGNTGKGLLPPKEAMSEANKIIGNLDHPYHKKDHPNHKAAVEEVAGFFEMARPQN